MAQATKLFDLSNHAAVSAPRPVAKPVAAPVAVLVERELAPQVFEGPRKLVRPRMPENHSGAALAPRRLRGQEPLVRHEGHKPITHRADTSAASHAEALYFHKQMQAQTPIVFVLEDGESIQGVVEWFDRDTIKVRNTTRILVFKRSVKYLYKAGEGKA